METAGAKMNNINPFRAGISMAASWSWGASLGVGVAVMHTMGVEAFIIWSITNILAIPFFGMLYTKIDSYKYIIELRPMIFFMFMLQGFAILINQQLLFEGLTGGVDFDIAPILAQTPATVLAIALAVALVLFINRTLLRGSLLTDYVQYSLQLSGVVLLLIVAFYTSNGTINPNVASSAFSDIRWAVWVGLGLIVGPSMDAMQFQRIEQVAPEHQLMSTIYGGITFGVYLSFVGVAALFIQAGSIAVALAFMIVVLSISTSTIDSASAAMHRLATKKVATAVALGIAFGWPLLMDVGVTGIWTIYTSGRVFVVSGVLVFLLVLYLTGRNIQSYTGRQEPSERDKTLQAVGD